MWYELFLASRVIAFGTNKTIATALQFQILSKRLTLDCFSFIRMINYIRSEKPSAGLVMSLASTDLWNDEKYMKPVSWSIYE